MKATMSRAHTGTNTGLQDHYNALVAELVDAPDLGSGGLGRVGSSPIRRTRIRRTTLLYCPAFSFHLTQTYFLSVKDIFFNNQGCIIYPSRIYFSSVKNIYFISRGYVLHPSKTYSSTVKDISFTHEEYVFHQPKIYPSFRTNIFFAFHTYINIRTRSPRPFSVNIQMKARNSHPRATNSEKRASRHAAHTQKDGARRSSNNRMRHLYIHGLSV